MIIVAGVRSGGTQFSLTMAEETGLKFIGELNYNLFQFSYYEDGINFKSKYHETNAQPTLTAEIFSDALENHEKYIILANEKAAGFLFNKAEYVLLRKNTLNVVLSLYTYLGKIKNISKDALFRQIVSNLNCNQLIVELYHYYMLTNKKLPKLEWYENLYEERGRYTTDTINRCVEILNWYNGVNPRTNLIQTLPGY